MFQTAPGNHLPFPERMREEYMELSNALRFHISYEKLSPLLYDFLNQLTEPLFLIIQLPLNQADEEKLQEAGEEGSHAQVYYLDGCSRDQLGILLDRYAPLFLADGISEFGIASHETGDELFIQKYKLCTLFTQDFQRYRSLLERYGLHSTEQLLTAWDTFTQDTPGSAMSVQVDGRNVYQVVEELREQGLYAAQIVED